MQLINEGIRLLVMGGVLWLAARAMGGVFDRLHQPRVVGEILGGLALGPTGLGAAWPEVHHGLFGSSGAVSMLGWLSWGGLALLMFNTGIVSHAFGRDRDLPAVGWLTATGTIMPLLAGWAIAHRFDFAPYYGPAATPLKFGLFLAMAMTVTAIPVISRIFQDLDLLGTRFAHVVLGVAFIEDLILWVGLTVLIGGRWHSTADPSAVAGAIGQLVTVVAFVAGRLPFLWDDRTPALLSRFRSVASGIVVPAFFAGVGLKLDLIHGFPFATLLALLAASVGLKTLATLGGGRLAGFRTMPSLHLAVALNARGALGVVLATVGLHAGLITAPFYSLLVLISLITTQLAGVWLRGVRRWAPHQLELAPDRAERLPQSR